MLSVRAGGVGVAEAAVTSTGTVLGLEIVV